MQIKNHQLFETFECDEEVTMQHISAVDYEDGSYDSSFLFNLKYTDKEILDNMRKVYYLEMVEILTHYRKVINRDNNIDNILEE